jgi:hypothetical protein
MARRTPQSAVKRAREQAQREKREMKQAKKDARTAARRQAEDPTADDNGLELGPSTDDLTNLDTAAEGEPLPEDDS